MAAAENGENARDEELRRHPADVRQRSDAGKRVILILLDAFGLEFLERHRDHSLIQRLDVTPLASQFPSTRTAHVSSVHFGVPVHEHGLYEWNVLEPTLAEMICPLRCAVRLDCWTPSSWRSAGRESPHRRRKRPHDPRVHRPARERRAASPLRSAWR